jgi:hypothetical protein
MVSCSDSRITDHPPVPSARRIASSFVSRATVYDATPKMPIDAMSFCRLGGRC